MLFVFLCYLQQYIFLVCSEIYIYLFITLARQNIFVCFRLPLFKIKRKSIVSVCSQRFCLLTVFVFFFSFLNWLRFEKRMYRRLRNVVCSIDFTTSALLKVEGIVKRNRRRSALEKHTTLFRPVRLSSDLLNKSQVRYLAIHTRAIRVCQFPSKNNPGFSTIRRDEDFRENVKRTE